MVILLPTVDPCRLRPELQGAISQLAAENQPAVKTVAATRTTRWSRGSCCGEVSPAWPTSPPSDPTAAIRAITTAQARRGLPAGARGHRRSGLRGCSGNGHRPGLTDARPQDWGFRPVPALGSPAHRTAVAARRR